MDSEERYIVYFNDTYQGRLSISVGYGPGLTQIYPFVFEDSTRQATGVVGLSILDDGSSRSVQIFHLSTFNSRRGDGSTILDELCDQADRFGVVLAVSPISLPNGRDSQMNDEDLRTWYGRFGFTGAPSMVRKPSLV